MYRVHEIKIRKEDYAEANAILLKHELLGDIDEMDWDEYNAKTMEGTNEAYVVYRIRPFIYEDYETIVKEFKEAGIQVL